MRKVVGCEHRYIDIAVQSQPMNEGAVVQMRVACRHCGLPFIFRGPRVDERGQVLGAMLTMMDSQRHEQVRAYLPRGSLN